MPGFTQIPNDWVFDDPLWTSEKFTKGMALIDLYRLQQYHPNVIQKRGIIIELEPGQIGWSQAELSKRWKRSIGWVRRLLKYLKKAGHIELQKTNVSTTITLLHWINNDTANKHANGKQTVSQTESKRYPNNIVNKGNRVNMEKKKPLIKHCPECHSTKKADRAKPWDCICDKCGVQMVDEFELELKKPKKNM